MTRLLTSAIAALMIATTALPAQAWISMNGTEDNGITRNGITHNGVKASGTSVLAIELPPQPE
jgi:hypothetical protein